METEPSEIDVVYVLPEDPGYHPVTYMARLAAELFRANLIIVGHPRLSIFEKACALAPRPRDARSAILICPQPANLAAIVRVQGWRKQYRQVVAWVFDSFWVEYIPRFVTVGRLFDYIFVTENDDLGAWRRFFGARVEWLPWGADAFKLGTSVGARSTDLQRLGRQPLDWEDDQLSASRCQEFGIRFKGRPQQYDDATAGEVALMNQLSNAKFTLSFSNKASPGIQVHPSREYITARWTDALAAGAIVAGIPPRSDGVSSLLWNAALLDLKTTDQIEGLQILAAAIKSWSPMDAKLNHVMALERLDWRWRFQRIAEVLNVKPDTLLVELQLLKSRAQELRSEGLSS